jgi:hypothetical protein
MFLIHTGAIKSLDLQITDKSDILEGFRILTSSYDGRNLVTDIKHPWISQCTRVKPALIGCSIFLKELNGVLQTCPDNISLERLSILEAKPFIMSKHTGPIWVASIANAQDIAQTRQTPACCHCCH